jgi:hypothetical protein
MSPRQAVLYCVSVCYQLKSLYLSGARKSRPWYPYDPDLSEIALGKALSYMDFLEILGYNSQ